MRKAVLPLAGLLAIIILCVVFYFLGDTHAVQSMTIKRVTPDQIANAMKGDYFYTDYRENTLIVKGQVESVSKSAGTSQLTFKTSSSFQAYCDLANGTVVPKTGDIVTALSEGGPALRQTNGVLLVNCTIP